MYQTRRQLFADVAAGRSPRRSPGGLAISLVVHLALGAGLLVLAGIGTSTVPTPIARALTLVSISSISAVPPPVPVAPIPAPPPRTVERPHLELLAQPVEAPPLESVGAELSPLPQPGPREQPTVRREPPKAVATSVTVGAFQTSAMSTRPTEQSRQVQTTGFDVPTAQSPELTLGTLTVGAFKSIGAVDPRPGSDRPAAVADAGFGIVGSAPTKPAVARPLGQAGFDPTNNDGRARPSRPTTVAEVQQSGFSDVRPSSPAPRPSPQPDRVNVPVEVISKPAPAYTDEARSLKLEGEVLLEVDFCATGQVRVLRVVRGLGHGLDEAAVRAAERIQFKPARDSTGPVDFRTTVQITFRLT